MALVALAGSVVAASGSAAQTSAPMEFPPTGSRWITRSLDQAGGSYLTTYTVPGTPAVITTLWKVDDRASFALMREFYDRLATVDAGQALQAAQRAAMKEFPHPFAWAAFGLTGVSR